jgi:CBS-domain-containing membrane protein
MLATRSFHPPGGATALLAVVTPQRMGFARALGPTWLGRSRWGAAAGRWTRR